MKFLLTACFVGLTLRTSAQTIVQSSQTADNEKTLSITLVGTRDGRPFRHNLQFSVTGLSPTQRDSLRGQTIRALQVLGITNVPSLNERRDSPVDAPATGSEVTFRCATCTGKGRLEVYGDGGYVMTRSFKTKRDAQPFFPYQCRLGAGAYRLVYVQNGVRQIESTFTVKVGEPNLVVIK